MNSPLLTQISFAIKQARHQPFEIRKITSVAGGSINETFCLEGTDRSLYFLKLNDARYSPMFAAEAAGLEVISATNTLRVPSLITQGIAGDQSFLVLEYLELSSYGDANLLGQQLAMLHRCTSSYFGFATDNFIGTSSQPNTRTSDWITFWREQRLGFQLRLAAKNNLGIQMQSLGKQLLDTLPVFFNGYTPQPSLLHGDLWSGNHAFLTNGTPTIFDPAIYYGDRECDLAMTELFGGYPAQFYVAYRATWPLDEGYASRRDLYNLYHILNHANLFGGGYVNQAEGMMQRLLLR